MEDAHKISSVTIINLISRAVGLGVTVLIARVINAEILGYYGLGRKFQELTKLITTQGTGALLLKNGTNSSKDVLNFILVNSLVIQCVLLMIFIFIDNSFFGFLIPGVLFVSITKFIELNLVSKKKPIFASIYVSLISDIPFILALILYQISDINVSSNLISITLSFSYALSIFKISVYKNLKINRYSLKKYVRTMKLSFSYFMPRLNGVLLTSLNVFIVARMLSVESSAYFNTSLRLATLSNMVLIAFVSTRAPKIANNFKNQDYARVKTTLKSDMIYLAVIGIAVLLVYIFMGPTILEIWGHSFSKYHDLLILLSLGQTINLVGATNGQILLLCDGHRTLTKISTLIVIINPILLYLLIGLYGAYGAAIAYILVMLLFNILKTRYAFKLLHEKITYTRWTT